MMDWDRLAELALAGEAPARGDLLGVLEAPDDELLPLLHAAYRVRRRHFGNRVRVHVLLNAKSGLCPEDCGFCSQSAVAESDVARYRLLPREEMLAAARRAKDAGAWKFCIVTSTRGPSARELDAICDAVTEIKAQVGIKICTSLGHLTEEQAGRLAAAGVDRVNHNLETSERHFPKICSTHTYEDRVTTVRRARAAGMEACSGGIVGMGETPEDRVDMAFRAREEGIESIPVNVFDPRPGTPLGDVPPLGADAALKILAMFRFANPTRDLRIAGGREAVLKSRWPLALYPCNSMFTSGYLTTPGNEPAEDLRVLREWGFVEER